MAQQLANELPDDWTIICNKMVFNDFGDKREIDFVVVGRHGVYVLDEKSWVGQITAEEGHWTLPSGEELPSPVDKVSMSATFVAMQMKRSIPALDAYLDKRYFVFGYVLFSSPKASLVGLDGAVRNKVLDTGTAAQTLIGFDASRKGTPGDVEQYRKQIIDWFGHPPELPKMTGGRAASHRSRLVYLVFAVLILAVVAAGAFLLLSWDHPAVPPVTASHSESPSPAPTVGATTPARSWKEARFAHNGEFVVVEGRVAGEPGIGGGYVFLNLGVPYVKGQGAGFGVWLRPDSLGESAEVLRNEFKGQLVKAAGIVDRDSSGRPYIVISQPSAIWHRP